MKTYKTPIMKPVMLNMAGIIASSLTEKQVTFSNTKDEQEGTQGFETEYAFE